jgi:hypothetical protein
MNTPFQTSGADWNVPNLHQALRDWQARQNQATTQISSGLSKIGQAVAGGIQAARNPAAFGKGTSPASAAVMGAFMNTAGADGGGQTSVDAPTFANANNTGFAGLVSPQNGQSDGNTFARFAAMGKMADATRNLMKQSTPALPGQDPKVMGYTDDEWDHIGTTDKIGAFTAVKQANDMKVAQQAYDMGQVHLQQAQAQAAAASEDRAAWKRFGAAYQQATAPQLNAGPDGFHLYNHLATGDLVSPGATLTGQQMQDMAMRAGVNPADSLALSREALNLAKAQKDLNAEGLPAQFIEDPVSGQRFLGRGNTTLPSGSNPQVANQNLPSVEGFTGVPTGRGGVTWLKTGNTVSATEQFKALHQDKLRLITGKAAVSYNPELVKQYDDAINRIDERLNQLANPDDTDTSSPTPATSRYKIQEVK